MFGLAGWRMAAIAMLVLGCAAGAALASDIAEREIAPPSATATSDHALLPEERRRTIYRQLVAAEHRARLESLAAYPDKLHLQKQFALERELTVAYRAEIAQQHGIEAAQATTILDEGIEKNWPAP